jgi:hypothetical protein
VAVTAKKLIETALIGLKRKFIDRTTALRAVPVSLVHLPRTSVVSSTSSVVASRISAFCSVAIAAKKLAESALVGFKRKLRDGTATLRAAPVSLVHLPLESAIVLIVCHFVLNYYFSRPYSLKAKWLL